MKATSCLEIFSRLIFSAATLGMTLEDSSCYWELRLGTSTAAPT